MRFRVPAGLRPATRPRTFGVRCAPAKQQRYAGPIPAPAPGSPPAAPPPAAACGARARAAARGSPVRASPAAAPAAARSRRAAARPWPWLSRGVPPVAPAAAAPPGAPAAAGACPGPGGLRPPGPRPPGRGSCRPPSAPLRAPLRGWGALGLLRAAVAPLPSRPGSPLPCPRPFGPGVGPSGPPGLLRPGGGWAALRAAWISRRPPGWRETGEGGAAAAALSCSEGAFAAYRRAQAPPAAPRHRPGPQDPEAALAGRLTALRA